MVRTSRPEWILPGRSLASVIVFVALMAFVVGPPSKDTSVAQAFSEPNVLLISLDTVRSDSLHVYGSRLDTPNIDAVARGGVVFANFFAHSSWTRPSFGSLFTSLYPSQHLAERNVDLGINRQLDARFLTMAEILKKAGYKTAGFSGNVNVDPVYGFDQGFAVFPGTALRPKDSKLPYPAGNEVFAAFQNWFKQNQHQKFFAWVNLMDAHLPYAAPAKYRAGLTDPHYSGQIGTSFSDADVARHPDLSEADKREIRALYQAGIRYDDDIVGRIMELLDRAGLKDSTLVIITADHGEEFWEHGAGGSEATRKAGGAGSPYDWGFEHGHTLYDELIHVPLIMRYPKAFGTAGKVATVTQVVRQVDVLPTVLDVAGVPAPKKVAFEGSSVKQALLGHSIPEREVYSESLHYGAEVKSVRTGKYKLILHPSSGQVELYDLSKDPGEKLNIAATSPTIVKALQSRLTKWMDRVKQSEATKESSKAAPADKRTETLLKSLGY